MKGCYLLAFDPSKRSTGWAVIGWKEGPTDFTYLKGGFIDTDCALYPYHYVAAALSRIRREYPNPLVIAKEKPLAETKVATDALRRVHRLIEREFRDIPTRNYHPKTIKKTVTGYGNSSKDQVAEWARELLAIPQHVRFRRHDVSDALAAGITFLIDEGFMKFPSGESNESTPLPAAL